MVVTTRHWSQLAHEPCFLKSTLNSITLLLSFCLSAPISTEQYTHYLIWHWAFVYMHILITMNSASLLSSIVPPFCSAWQLQGAPIPVGNLIPLPAGLSVLQWLDAAERAQAAADAKIKQLQQEVSSLRRELNLRHSEDIDATKSQMGQGRTRTGTKRSQSLVTASNTTITAIIIYIQHCSQALPHS